MKKVFAIILGLVKCLLVVVAVWGMLVLGVLAWDHWRTLGELPWGILAAVAGLAVLVSIGLLLKRYVLNSLGKVPAENLFSQKLEFIKTAAQILGGFFFLITIYLTYQNWQVAQEKQVTDLFTKAIEQLGNERLVVCLGGIYALERIARDSEKDYGSIMEILTAYVREKAPWPPRKDIADPDAGKAKKAKDRQSAGGPEVPKPENRQEEEFAKPKTDIQAILTAIGRRSKKFRRKKKIWLDLQGTDLRRADLVEANLENTVLFRANLAGADLRWADLRVADLVEANLEGANLKDAKLMSGIFGFGIVLHGADLRGANLRGADLSAANVSWQQIQMAIIDEKTKLPDYVERERQREEAQGESKP